MLVEDGQEVRHTQRVEENASLHDKNADNFSRQEDALLLGVGQGIVGSGLGENDTVANVLDKEGEEDASHDDGRGDGLVAKLTNALVTKHEGSMGVELFDVSADVFRGGTREVHT